MYHNIREVSYYRTVLNPTGCGDKTQIVVL